MLKRLIQITKSALLVLAASAVAASCSALRDYDYDNRESPLPEGTDVISLVQRQDAALTLVFLPSGFTAEDLGDDGPFMTSARNILDILLTSYPLNAYVSRIAARAYLVPSEESGITEDASGRFLGVHLDDTHVRVDNTATTDCRKQFVTTAGTYIGIVVCNTEITSAVSSVKYISKVGDAFVPYRNPELKGLVLHEVIGHCLALLTDEYYTPDTTASKSSVDRIISRHNSGTALNVLTSPNITPWLEIGLTPEEIALHEGADGCEHGLWRSSETSIMRNPTETTEFNAVCRRLIDLRCEEVFGKR